MGDSAPDKENLASGDKPKASVDEPATSQSGSDQSQGNGKGKGKKDASKLDLNEAVQLTAAVTLQLADQASRVQLDTSFLLTMKNEQGPENLLPVMYNVWKAGKPWRPRSRRSWTSHYVAA